MQQSLAQFYRNKRILITGGVGFLGSNLALALHGVSRSIILLDNYLDGHGANDKNIEPIRADVDVVRGDVRDRATVEKLVGVSDVIFHLAGQVNHVQSMRDPLLDLDINARGTLIVLEACRTRNPSCSIIFTGTRGQYGPTVKLPVDENHPMNPKGVYAITNLAAEKMLIVYHDVHGLRTVALRISNTFGPRHQMHHDQYGVVNWFIRKALDNELIPVFGDGSIVRDYLYVDDTVEALLQVGAAKHSAGQVYNVGSGVPTSFRSLAAAIVRVVGSGRHTFTSFTEERRALEPGDYYADITKIRTQIGWQPRVALEDGIARTADYYRTHRSHYW